MKDILEWMTIAAFMFALASDSLASVLILGGTAISLTVIGKKRFGCWRL